MKKVKLSTKIAAVGIALVVVAGALFVGGMSLLDWDFRKLDNTVWTAKEYAPETETTVLTSAVIDCDSSYVKIEKGDSLAIQYEESDKVKYEVECEGGTLTVRERRLFKFTMFDFHTPKMSIVLPSTASLSVNAVNGDLEINDNSFVELNIDIVNCDMYFDGIEVAQSAIIETVNGNVTLHNMTVGNLRANSINGDIKATEVTVKNYAELGTVNGDVSAIKFTAANVKFETVNGDVYTEELAARECELGTVNGEIESRDNQTRDWSAETVNGSINANFKGEEREYRIECHTVNGSKNMHDREDGEKSITAETVNGDIGIWFSH